MAEPVGVMQLEHRLDDVSTRRRGLLGSQMRVDLIPDLIQMFFFCMKFHYDTKTGRRRFALRDMGVPNLLNLFVEHLIHPL